MILTLIKTYLAFTQDFSQRFIDRPTWHF